MDTKSVSGLVAWSRAAGLVVSITKGGHTKIETPAGPVFMPATAGDRRAGRNARSFLRRKLREAGWPEEELPP